MRIARGERYIFLSLLMLAAASGAAAGESRNPALPDPADLVILDEAIVSFGPPAAGTDEAVQRAFPAFYGEVPATVSRESARQPREETGAILSTVLDPEEIEAAGGDAAENLPVPLPPPAELLEEMPAPLLAEGAGALPAARGSAVSVPSIGAGDPTPPLPELASRAATLSLPGETLDFPAVPAAPAFGGGVYSMPGPPPTLEQVQAEFATLKTYCEADHLGSAAEIYSRMPDFGTDDQINRLRADAANLLILGLARDGNLMAARRVYDSVPAGVVGFDARLAKARAIINLTTYYIRARQYADAFDVLMDAGSIQNRSALNNELFRLMARMIPYLDNAEETEKAENVYNLLLSEVKSPGTAALFAENVRASVLPYCFHYVDNSDSPVHRRKRLDFLEHIFFSLDSLARNEDILALKRTLGRGLAERYAGDPDRAAQFDVEM